MRKINQQSKELETLFKKYSQTHKEIDFNNFYNAFNKNLLFYYLVKRFPGIWKIEKIVDNVAAGIENIKNDVLIELYRGKLENNNLNYILNEISFKILDTLKNKEEILRILPNILEYSYSISYKNYYDYQEILNFSDFLLLELFNIIYEAFYQNIKKDHLIVFYHTILLLSLNDVQVLLEAQGIKKDNIKKAFLEEIKLYEEEFKKREIYLLIAAFIEGIGDLEQFTSFLGGNYLDIYKERIDNKLNYDSIDKKLNLIGSEQLMSNKLTDYIKSLRLVEKILENENLEIKYKRAVWQLISAPLYISLIEFIKDLFNKEENILRLDQELTENNLFWENLRKIEEFFNFPHCYLEQFRFNSEITELFPFK